MFFSLNNVQLINLRPSSKAHAKPRATPRRDKENPTGLVTKLGGTIVKDGLTTVHETSVIGTYINGKYAQVLQSSSRILTAPAAPVPEGRIRPSNTHRILKTIGPQQHGKLKPQLEPTPTHQQQEESSLPLEVLFDTSSGMYLSNRALSIIFLGIREWFGLTLLFPRRSHLDQWHQKQRNVLAWNSYEIRWNRRTCLSNDTCDRLWTHL